MAIACLYEAMVLAVKLRLWSELDCIAPTLAWLDPYSVALSSVKADSYWFRAEWHMFRREHSLTEKLVRLANFSEQTMRYPLLPESVADIWTGGLRSQLVFSSLRLCFARGQNASLAVYGKLAEAPPELERLRDYNVREIYSPVVLI